MELLLRAVQAAAPAIAFLAAPFAASTLLALVCAAIHARLRHTPVEGETGAWLQRQLWDGLEAGIAPTIAGSADGFWPALGYIGLAPKTWCDSSLAGRTIAAHELGHAALWRDDPELGHELARARQGATLALTVAGAGILVGGLLDHLPSIVVGFTALGISLLLQLAVLFDEARASLVGRQLLERQRLRTTGTDVAMGAAFSVYAVPFVVRAAFLVLALPFSRLLLDGPITSASNHPLLLWAVLMATPLLVLRALQVGFELRQPPARTNAFQLNWTLYQEHAWAFHSGSIVLLWLFLGHDQPVTEGLAWLFLLGVLPAMGPLGGFGRLVVLLPLLTVLTLVGFTAPERRYATPREPDPLRFLPATGRIAAVAGSLVRIAWIPLAIVLFRRALSGW